MALVVDAFCSALPLYFNIITPNQHKEHLIVIWTCVSGQIWNGLGQKGMQWPILLPLLFDKRHSRLPDILLICLGGMTYNC